MLEREILATTYMDRMDIIRYEEVEDSETSLTEMKEIVKYRNVKCELDQGSDIQLKDAIDSIVADYIVFTYPDIDVLVGDRLVIAHQGKEYECVAGQPYQYISHLDIPVYKKDRY